MDLDNLFKRAFDGFGEQPEPAEFPGVPGSEKATGNGQSIDVNDVSRCSRFSRSEMGGIGSDEFWGAEKNACFLGEDRANVSPQKTPGNTGTPGNEAKSLAESMLLQFPVKDREPGTPGTGSDPCGRPALDLNQAAPQRLEWLRDATVAALAPSLMPALPISPADVRAGVERELRALADLGRSGPDTLRDAIEITRAKIRNSAALVERQPADGRCHVCRGSLDDSRPEVSVMQGKPGLPLHMHADCHAEHKRRRTEIVDRIMAAANLGADRMGGEA